MGSCIPITGQSAWEGSFPLGQPAVSHEALTVDGGWAEGASWGWGGSGGTEKAAQAWEGGLLGSSWGSLP